LRSRVAAGLVLAAVAAGAALTAAPASAVCQVYVGGHCYNACSAVGIVYDPARDASGGKLPQLYCLT
jgi:hypothetical protein